MVEPVSSRCSRITSSGPEGFWWPIAIMNLIRRLASVHPSVNPRNGPVPLVQSSPYYANMVWRMGKYKLPLRRNHLVPLSCWWWQSINQSINQISIAPISLAKPGSVAQQMQNHEKCYSSCKSRPIFKPSLPNYGQSTGISRSHFTGSHLAFWQYGRMRILKFLVFHTSKESEHRQNQDIFSGHEFSARILKSFNWMYILLRFSTIIAQP